MTAPVAITIESVESVGPFVIQTSGNIAYVGIWPDLFCKALAIGTIEFLLQDAYEAAADYESYDRVLFITPEQAALSRGISLPFKQAGFRELYMLKWEKPSGWQPAGRPSGS